MNNASFIFWDYPGCTVTIPGARVASLLQVGCWMYVGRRNTRHQPPRTKRASRGRSRVLKMPSLQPKESSRGHSFEREPGASPDRSRGRSVKLRGGGGKLAKPYPIPAQPILKRLSLYVRQQGYSPPPHLYTRILRFCYAYF